jgi:chemotaxis protein CheD
MGYKMNPLKTHLPVVNLKPGEMYFSSEPGMVFTILGSCISIIMYNPRLKLAAICHSLLPQDKKNDLSEDKLDNAKYLPHAFHSMYNWLESRGVKDSEIIIKVFGGGKVLPSDDIGGRRLISNSIGSMNIDSALRLILGKKMIISAIDVGGEMARKVFFYTHTGEVLLKRIKRGASFG